MIYQPERVLLFRIISSLVPTNVGKVLDIGGADGSRYKSLFKTNQYVSLDIDSSSNPTIVASADNLPIESESIDTILCSQMLEHVVNPQRCLEEMFRVLKKSGICIVTVPFFMRSIASPLITTDLLGMELFICVRMLVSKLNSFIKEEVFTRV